MRNRPPCPTLSSLNSHWSFSPCSANSMSHMESSVWPAESHLNCSCRTGRTYPLFQLLHSKTWNYLACQPLTEPQFSIPAGRLNTNQAAIFITGNHWLFTKHPCSLRSADVWTSQTHKQ